MTTGTFMVPFFYDNEVKKAQDISQQI